jgi:hypothetical protein
METRLTMDVSFSVFPHTDFDICNEQQFKGIVRLLLEQALATCGTRAKRGTPNDFQWHAE